jgi:hypothetical protein
MCMLRYILVLSTERNLNCWFFLNFLSSFFARFDVVLPARSLSAQCPHTCALKIQFTFNERESISSDEYCSFFESTRGILGEIWGLGVVKFNFLKLLNFVFLKSVELWIFENRYNLNFWKLLKFEFLKTVKVRIFKIQVIF